MLHVYDISCSVTPTRRPSPSSGSTTPHNRVRHHTLRHETATPRHRHHIHVYMYIWRLSSFQALINRCLTYKGPWSLCCCSVIVSFKGSNDTQVRTNPTFVYRLLYTKTFPLPLSIPPQSPVLPSLFYPCTHTLLLCTSVYVWLGLGGGSQGEPALSPCLYGALASGGRGHQPGEHTPRILSILQR